MKSVKIRPTHIRDYDGVVELLQKTELARDWFTEEVFRRLMRKNRGLYFVAEADGKIVGNVFTTHDGGYYAYLYKLAVDPGFQRRHIALKLWTAVSRVLKRARIDWIFLHVRKDNERAIKFFKRAGFKVRATHYLMDRYL